MGGVCSAYGGEERRIQDFGFWWGNLREGDHLEDQGIDGRIILRWVFSMWVYGLDRAGSGKGQVSGTCECGNELSGSIKCGETFD